ncbi:response regulator [Ornithinibacillus sp. BX22]|uniref:Response regulator n=1 Tax=Ornithinibacillus hominis TaxID=2763055 RepID=A0A923L2M7_9BACI|nr:response regulator [Ornithinibacillus hominis]MBC5635354.1 response regulator [Ornithinibacillus hominis]
MKVILIDDEHLALTRLEHLFAEYIDEIEVVGAYQNASQALKEIEVISPDVVFLDIEMPGMNGLELAGKIQEINHHIEIVFVTGYNEYAIEAFELFAFDYILKPILGNRLRKSLTQLQRRISNSPLPSTEGGMDKAWIQCFNQIKVKGPDYKEEALKWRTSKAQELFAYLFHNRGKMINKEILVDLLWPSTNNTQQLYTTIYHIRRTLKQYGLESLSIQSGNGGYTLTADNIKIDTEEWEQHLNQLEPISDKNYMEYEQVFYEYKGDYLGQYGYLWAEGEKERFKRLWLNHSIKLIRFYQNKGINEDAIKICQRIQQMYPDVEESYFELMKIYATMNKLIAVEEQYRRLTSLLTRELGVEPSRMIRNWYKNWKRKKV